MIPLLSSLIEFGYTRLLKPIYFRLDPEYIHDQKTQMGAWSGEVPIVRELMRFVFAYENSQLKRTFNGITFPNPVGLAAGFDYNADLTQIMPSIGFGFHTVGTITLEPYEGNPKPRLGRFPGSKALLVNKGFKSIGARAIIRKLTGLRFENPVGISIGSTNKGYHTVRDQIIDILCTFRLFEDSAVTHSYYELNISCPNTFGGEPFTSPERLDLLLACLDKLKLTRPVYVKFPIDQNDSESLALLNVIAKHNIQGVILGNLSKDKKNPAMQIEDLAAWQTKKGNVSGKPTWERSNHLIQLTKQTFGDRFTIIGTGGVFSGEDAATKLKLGADLVQLITGMIFQGPQLMGQINHHLATAPSSRSKHPNHTPR